MNGKRKPEPTLETRTNPLICNVLALEKQTRARLHGESAVDLPLRVDVARGIASQIVLFSKEGSKRSSEPGENNLDCLAWKRT